jgi:predicted phosphodiesterase
MLLLIGDIHGRSFWKKAVEEYKDKVDRIIFIGDYLDPYPWEGITRKDAIANFQEIIDFKAENKDKVVLFVGNHDLAYIDKRNYTVRSRYDSSNAYHIEEMFRSHRSFFQLAHEELVGDKRYLFTHAGLQKGWYDAHEKLIGELSVNGLNHLLEIPEGIRALCEASWARGGYDRYGSIVWNDVTECRPTINEELPWDFQIFGHSQQDEHPIIAREFACIDCRKPILLHDDGSFEEI